MKRILMLIISLTFMLCLSSCSDGAASGETSGENVSEAYFVQTESSDLQTNTESAADANTDDTQIKENPDETNSENSSKILVAFFSRTGENYGVGVIEKGNTHIIADMIAEELNADTFEIVRVTPYPETYRDCTDEAQEEKTANARPELTAAVENFDGYDIIFLGYPNWW